MNGAILVVSSDVAAAQWLHDRLLDLGYAVEMALHGGDALMLASLSRPDAVLLDADLCDATGLAVMRDLHGIDRTMAVVVLCNAGDAMTARAAVNGGALECLTRPVDADTLARAAAVAVAAGRGAQQASAPAPPPAGAPAAETCAVCQQPVTDRLRAVAYKRALFHAACWLERRRTQARRVC